MGNGRRRRSASKPRRTSGNDVSYRARKAAFETLERRILLSASTPDAESDDPLEDDWSRIAPSLQRALYQTSIEPIIDGFSTDQLIVVGQSAGGGRTAAVSLMARDRGDVRLLGIGVASYVEITAGGGADEFEAIEVHDDLTQHFHNRLDPGHVPTDPAAGVVLTHSHGDHMASIAPLARLGFVIGDVYGAPFTLQMLRLAPEAPVALGTAVMSDLGLARYRGYADLPEAASLASILDREQGAHRRKGVHLIAVSSADGSLVVGDSHDYSDEPDPFSDDAVDDLILEELDAVLDLPGRRVARRWIGTYASADDRWRLTDAPEDRVRAVTVTGGTGASTAFGIAEETIKDLFD